LEHCGVEISLEHYAILVRSAEIEMHHCSQFYMQFTN